MTNNLSGVKLGDVLSLSLSMGNYAEVKVVSLFPKRKRCIEVQLMNGSYKRFTTDGIEGPGKSPSLFKR